MNHPTWWLMLPLALLACTIDSKPHGGTQEGSDPSGVSLTVATTPAETNASTQYAQPLPPSRCDPADPLCVDLAASDPSWWTESGWLIVSVLVGDVDGDGQIDAVVNLAPEAGGAGRASVVLGPFGADARVLPRDEDVSVGAAVEAVWDISGDSIADLVTVAEDPTDMLQRNYGVIEGPLSAPAPSPVVLPSGGPIAVLERPGFVEGMAYWVEPVGVWHGPWVEWGVGAADVRFDVTCGQGLTESALRVDHDADGLPEWNVFAGAWTAGCERWIVPGSASGTVSLPAEPTSIAVPDEQRDIVWLGDVDGDGDNDFRIGDLYLAGPLSLAPGQWPGGAPLFADVPVVGAEPLHVDLDGDGMLDFSVRGDEVPGYGTGGWVGSPRAYIHEYVTSAQGGGLFDGVGIARVVADDDVLFHVIHLDDGGPTVISYWEHGDAVVVARVPGT